MLKKNIRVLIVDDSILVQKILSDILTDAKGMEVVGISGNAKDAEQKIIALKPDVVTLDVIMPDMTGIEFLKAFYPHHPVPVVMVSSLSSKVFDALNAGAVDFVVKPSALDQKALTFFASELITKIKIASLVRLKQKNFRPLETKAEEVKLENKGENHRDLIAMGASTGGTEAVYEILRILPKQMPGIVIVQHMPPGFTKLYAQRLNSICAVHVKEAEDGEVIESGTAYIAPGGMQMEVMGCKSSRKIHCYEGKKTNGHCPSVDVLFQSAAQSAGDRAVGVLLTGMGKDGARGLLSMKQKGAYTIAQDEKTSVVYGMPKEALSIGAVNNVLPLHQIAKEIIRRILF